MRVLLISTYDLGHQPFGLASPAAWLREAGAQVTCCDLAVEPLDEPLVRSADLVAFHLPMHTATRLAVLVIARVRTLNPDAHLCAYGLYAAMNGSYLESLGVQSVIGGEFEEPLVRLAQQIGEGATRPALRETQLARQSFRVPERAGLPPLSSYAHVHDASGARRNAGYTEASRGCKHHCRHCPVVPVYDGHFRVVQREVVLEDVRRQVQAGATHITFGDPDFMNGPAHALAIVRELHREHPRITYDVTIKIEHLLRHEQLLSALRDTGCLFVTSAVESVDDRVLARLDKRHTRADFVRVAGLFRELGLTLNPTFVAFHPWLTRAGYWELLATLEELELEESVAPIQLSLRLLIPAGSKLLELEEVRALVGSFDHAALVHPWRHADARVDRLQVQVQSMVRDAAAQRESRRAIFERAWSLAAAALGEAPRPALAHTREWEGRVPVPFLSEPWYC